MSKMIKVLLDKVSKRYTGQWILKNVDYTFELDVVYGVKGINGSGKSTLLKMICGYLSPSAGNVIYESGNTPIPRDSCYNHVSIWAPYVSLIKELTISEMVDHFLIHKQLIDPLDKDQFYKTMNLPVSVKTKISDLSSGQEQRLGLALTILSSSDLLILDEPSSYLDEASKVWLYQLIATYSQDRIVIIASNDANDLQSCNEVMDIADYK